MRVCTMTGLPMCFLAMVLLTSASCRSGTRTGEVRGAITFQKKPVTEGTVTFFNPSTGHGVDCKIQEDSSYVVTTKERGLPVGEYTVTITPALYLDKSDPTTPPALLEKAAANIPMKYRREGSTPLKATVVEGKNDLVFDMVP